MDKRVLKVIKKDAAAFLICLAVAAVAVAIPVAGLSTGLPEETESTTEATTKQTTTTTQTTQEESEPLMYWDEIPLDAELQDYIVRKSESLNIRPAIVFAMIWKETGYDSQAIGDEGRSFGLMQVGVRYHYIRMLDLNCTNLLDPLQNVTVGIDILSELIDKYDGDVVKALVAYNQGSYKGTVTNYALAVMQEAERLDAYVLH